MPFRRSLIVALTIGAAACVPRAPQPTPTPPVARPVTQPTSTPTPVPTFSNWADAPQTPGDWRYAPVAGGSEARFGEATSEARFTMRCVSASRSIELIRFGNFAGSASMIVRTEHATRGLSGAPLMDNGALRAVLSAIDPLLDAMAFSKGRFAIEAPGAPTLYLPSWPEVTRVIEDCR